MVGKSSCRYCPPKAARGCATADSSRPMSRTPGSPPYTSIDSRWISMIRARLRKLNSMAAPSLSKLLEHAAVPLVDLLQRGSELGLFRFIDNRRDHQRPAVGDDVQRRVGIDVEQFQDRLIDHQRQAVSMLGKRLDHGLPPV